MWDVVETISFPLGSGFTPSERMRKAYPLALILSPTRELSSQIYDESKKFCYQTGLRPVVVYGGAPVVNQVCLYFTKGQNFRLPCLHTLQVSFGSSILSEEHCIASGCEILKRLAEKESRDFAILVYVRPNSYTGTMSHAFRRVLN